MDHQKFRELLTLLAYGDLSETERFTIEAHVQECPSCHDELQELNRLHKIIPRQSHKPSEQQLNEARAALHGKLFVKSYAGFIRSWLPYAAAAALFVVGIFSGYLYFRLNEEPQISLPTAKAKTPSERSDVSFSNSDFPFQRGDVTISNVNFADVNPKDGQVEFSFNATAPVHVKGSINDERVLGVLTKVLVHEQNPGLRLKAVNALRSPGIKQDDDVKAALLAAVRLDENVSVRLEALNALRVLPFDQEIKKALLQVLVHDQNPGVRVEAIKIIEAAHQYDGETMDVFKKQMSADNNNYIRTRARAIVEEVKQQ